MKNRPTFLNARALAMAMIIALVIAIKWCFADATACQLDWLLHPASKLVALCSGLTFTPLAGLGYYNAAEEILIAPACSGLNFFLIVLATGWCLLIRQRPSVGAGWWFLGIAVGAYGFSLAVNTCRILFAISLYRWQSTCNLFNTELNPLCSSLFIPERLHRLEGVVVYYFCLCLFVMLLSKLLPPSGKRAANFSPSHPRHGWLVAGLYLLFTLAIPLANGAAAKPTPFIEHGLTVLALVVGATLAGKGWKNRLKTR